MAERGYATIIESRKRIRWNKTRTHLPDRAGRKKALGPRPKTLAREKLFGISRIEIAPEVYENLVRC